MNNSNKSLQLGILGGGQLAQMLTLAAPPLGLQAHILSTSSQDPAAVICPNWVAGDPSDFESVFRFSKKKDLLTFESEFVNTDPLLELEAKTSAYIFPRPHLMKLFQYRSSQKATLESFNIPTAKYIDIKAHADLNKAWEKFDKRFVLKKVFGGYDGNGTSYVRSPRGLVLADQALVSQHFIAEELIAFQRELAVVFVRSRDGSCIHLPLVESKQIHSRCDWILGPVEHPAFPTLKKAIQRMLDKLNYVGCIAFELFADKKTLLVNEIAPRVHNSGHYSQEALLQNQFDLHLMAGLGMDLQPPQKISKSFVMINLVGQSRAPLNIPNKLSGKVHLYGKAENRPGRKMGHINYVGDNTKDLLKKAIAERKRFRL